MSSAESMSPALELGELRRKYFNKAARKVQFDRVNWFMFMCQIPCDYDGTGKETYVKVDLVSRVAQNGEQLKRIAAKQSVLGLTCQNMHRFEKKSCLQQEEQCYLCAKIIKGANPENTSELDEFYTCVKECAFCCEDCERVTEFAYSVNESGNQDHFELDGDNWDDGRERRPQESEILFGARRDGMIQRSLISILQINSDNSTTVIRETEVPFWLPYDCMYFSHSRDALFAKPMMPPGSKQMIVFYLRDLTWRMFRCPDAIIENCWDWHQMQSVSLVYENRVLAYYDKSKRDHATDEAGSFRLFDLHTQTEIVAVSNVFKMFFDSPQIGPLCKVEEQEEQPDVKHETFTAPLLKDCIEMLKNAIAKGVHEGRMPLDLGYTIKAAQEGSGATSWVLWHGKLNAESPQKLDVHVETTADSWDDCFLWLKEKTKEAGNRFFRHTYSPSSRESEEKVLAVWFWEDKEVKETDIALHNVEYCSWENALKRIESLCREKLKERRIIDVKIAHQELSSDERMISVVSVPGGDSDGLFELKMQEIDGDPELILHLIQKQIKRTTQLVGTSFCPDDLRSGKQKRLMSVEFHAFQKKAIQSGQLEHSKCKTTAVNPDLHKKIILARPRFIEAPRATGSGSAQKSSAEPVSGQYKISFYEFSSLTELTTDLALNKEIKEWELNESTQVERNESGELNVLDHKVYLLQTNAALDRLQFVHKTNGLIKGLSRRRGDKQHVYEYSSLPQYTSLYLKTQGQGSLSDSPVVLMIGSKGTALLQIFGGPKVFKHKGGDVQNISDLDSKQLVVVNQQGDQKFSIISLQSQQADEDEKLSENNARQAKTLLALEKKNNQHVEFPVALSSFANGFTMTSFVKNQIQVQVKFDQEFFEFVRYSHTDQIGGVQNYASSSIAYLTRDNRTACRSCLQVQDLKVIKGEAKTHEKQPDSQDKQMKADTCQGSMCMHVLAFDAYADSPSFSLKTIYKLCQEKVKPPGKASSKIRSVTAFGEMRQLCFQYEDSLVFIDEREETKVRCYPIQDGQSKESESNVQHGIGGANREEKQGHASEKMKVMEMLPIPVIVGADGKPYFIAREGDTSTSIKIKRGVNFYEEDQPVFEDVFNINSDKVIFFTRRSVRTGEVDSIQKEEFLLMDGSLKIKVLIKSGDKLTQSRTIELFANDIKWIEEQPFAQVSASLGVLHFGSRVFRLLNSQNSSRRADTWESYTLGELFYGDELELAYVNSTGNICLVRQDRFLIEAYLIPQADASYLDCLPIPRNGQKQANFCTFINPKGDFMVEQLAHENQRRFLVFSKYGQLLGTVQFKSFKPITNAEDEEAEELNADETQTNPEMTSLELVTCSQSKNYYVFKNEERYIVFELVSEATLQQRKEEARRDKAERQRDNPEVNLVAKGKRSCSPCCFPSKRHQDQVYPAASKTFSVDTLLELQQDLSLPSASWASFTQQLAKDQNEQQEPIQTELQDKVNQAVKSDQLWFQQLEFQSPDPFGLPLDGEKVTILDDSKPQFIRVQLDEGYLDLKHEVQKATTLSDCIEKLQNSIAKGLLQDRMPLDLGFTINAAQEENGATSWVVWHGKQSAQSPQKLDVHLLTTKDSWDDCFIWLREKIKQTGNRFFRHAYSQSACNSEEKVLAVWFWDDKEVKDTDLQLHYIDVKEWDDASEQIQSLCTDKLKGRRVIDAKIGNDRSKTVSIVSTSDRNINGTLNLREETSCEDHESILQKIQTDVRNMKIGQFAGFSMCPDYMKSGKRKRTICAQFISCASDKKTETSDTLTLRRCILVCLNPEQKRNFLANSQAPPLLRNEADIEPEEDSVEQYDKSGLILEDYNEMKQQSSGDTDRSTGMLQWWKNKHQTEDIERIKFKFTKNNNSAADTGIIDEPDLMNQCGRYLILKKGQEIFVYLPPLEYNTDSAQLNQPLKLKLQLKEGSQLFNVYPTNVKGIVQFHVQLKDMPAGVINWDVINDEQYSQFEAFSKTDGNQKHRLVKTLSEYKESVVCKEVEQYTPRVKSQVDAREGKQFNLFLDDENIVELDYNLPVQFFNKDRQVSMSPDEDRTNEKNEARVSTSYDAFLSFRQPGRVHYFMSDFDLIYWQRYSRHDTHELKQAEGTLARLSPYRLFVDGIPVLHKFIQEEMASDKLGAEKRTVLKLFIAALKAKFDNKKLMTRNVQLASFFMRYSPTISSPMRCAYEKNRQVEFEQMIDLLSLKKDFYILTWLFHRTYTNIELQSDNIIEMFELGLKQGEETSESIMLPWGGSKDQYFISDSFSYELRHDLQRFSINPPQKEYTNIFTWFWRMVMKVYGFLFKAVKATETAINKLARSLVVVVVGWFIRDPRYRLRATKTGFELGPEIKQITGQDKKQGKAEEDASEKLPIRRVQATFYDFSVLLGKNAVQLLQILANSKDEVFDFKQVQAIVGFLWDSYFDKIFDHCFMPFICEFLSWHLLTLVFVYEPDDLRGGFNYKYFNQLFWLYVFGKCYLSLFALELIQMRTHGIEYLNDYWNWIDIVSQATLTVHMVLHQFYEVRNSQMNVLAAFTSLLLWVKLFYWLRMFSGYGAFVRILMQIVADIRIFLIMLLICVAAFATTTFIFNKNRIDTDENSSLYMTAFNWSPADVMLGSWLTGLGDFRYDNYSNENAVPIWIIFILATIIIQLVFLNLLIAIMSESFNKIYANMERASVKETCIMILDHFWILNISETFAKNRYVLWLKATEEAEEDPIQMTQAKIQDVHDTVINMQTQLESTQNNNSNSIINLVELNQTKIENTQLEVQQTKNLIATELIHLRTDSQNKQLTQSKFNSGLQTGQQKMHDELIILKEELSTIKNGQREQKNDLAALKHDLASIKMMLTKQ